MGSNTSEMKSSLKNRLHAHATITIVKSVVTVHKKGVQRPQLKKPKYTPILHAMTLNKIIIN